MPAAYRAITLREGTYAETKNRLPGRDKTIGNRPNRPLSRNETIRPRPRTRRRTLQKGPLNRNTLSDRPALPAIPQRTTDHPEYTIERGKQDGEAGTEDYDARVDDEPLHHETHGARTTAATARKPTLRAHTARIVERAGKRDTITKGHFQSNLSSQVDWYVIAAPCYAVSHNVNTILLQHTPNLLNIIHIHASNANAAVDITITVLNNFELKRDTVQPKNYLPTQ